MNPDLLSADHHISSRTAAAQSASLSLLKLEQDSCYWLQTQPAQGGRITLMQHRHGQTRERLPAGYSIRSRVHEYGGGAYTVRGDMVVFCNDEDQRLYQFDLQQNTIQPITPESPSSRYGDLQLDPSNQRVYCVREQFSGDGEQPSADLISIALQPPYSINTLQKGSDFYSSPRISEDGSKLCWISWNHPDMPWDQSTLCYAQINTEGQIKQPQCLQLEDSAILQPCWSPEHQLYFISDQNNWWNIYRLVDGNVHPVCSADFDYARPPWVFGLSSYDFISSRQLAACYNDQGAWVLATIDIETGNQHILSRDFAEITYLQASAKQLVFIGAREDSNPSIQSYLPQQQLAQTLFQLPQPEINAQYFSLPKAFSYPSSDGHTGYALYYPAAQSQQLPAPLLVIAHGGPTSQFERALDIKIQYWTTRGYAVCAVNYAGSSGYGRRYRQRLHQQWGVLEVKDCIAAADQLVASGQIDADRIAIRGSSAGGYTVLAALCFHDYFAAGVSYYGISDMVRLHQETHKFESHYLERLIGRYPEDEALYQQRSPACHYQSINKPVLFLQGAKDRIVPPNQAELMHQALRQRGIHSELIIYPNEGHGFRDEKNIAHALDQELAFYQQVFKQPQ